MAGPRKEMKEQKATPVSGKLALLAVSQKPHTFPIDEPFTKDMILSAIKLIDTENLTGKTEFNLIQKIFSSLSHKKFDRDNALDILDVLISNNDQPVNLANYPRAKKAFINFIQLKKPTVDLGINYRGDHVVKRISFFTNPETGNKEISDPDIGKEATGCDITSMDEACEKIFRLILAK